MNNYTEEDVDRLSNPLEDVIYIIFGKEVGASGTPHLQGTVCFQSRKRLAQCIEILGQCHCTPTRFLDRSIEYCKKDGDFTEIGDVPEQDSKKGSRTDLEAFKFSVREGTCDMKELRELHSDVCARYPRFVREYLKDQDPETKVREIAIFLLCSLYPPNLYFAS